MSPDAHGAADHCGSRLGSGLLGCGARAPAVPLCALERGGARCRRSEGQGQVEL